MFDCCSRCCFILDEIQHIQKSLQNVRCLHVLRLVSKSIVFLVQKYKNICFTFDFFCPNKNLEVFSYLHIFIQKKTSLHQNLNTLLVNCETELLDTQVFSGSVRSVGPTVGDPPPRGFKQLCLRTTVVSYTTAIGHHLFFRCHTGVRFGLGVLEDV